MSSGGGDYGAKGDNAGASSSGFNSNDYGDYAPPGVANLNYYSSPDVSNENFASPDVSGLGSGWSGGGETAEASPVSGGTPDFGSDAYNAFASAGDTGLTVGGNSMLAETPTPGSVPLPPENPNNAFANYTPVGPAGTSGAPNIGAVREAVASGNTTSIGPEGGIDTGNTSPAFGPGPSAAATGIAGGGPASGDLSAARNRAAGPDDSGWMNSLGIKNPVGSAIAAAGMGFNMMQQRKLNDQIGTPSADLAQLARDLKASTSGITPAGTAIATQGVDDLRARAADLSPNAQTLQDRGTNLTGYAGTGTLPPEMQAQVTQATQDAKTARVSFYASRNMPTDPAKNTSLRADLERIDRDAVIMASTMASDLAKTGTGIYGAGLSGSGQAGGMEGTAGQIGTNLVNSGIQASGLQSQAYNQLAQIDAAQTARTQQAIADMARALSNTPTQQNIVVPLQRTG